MLGRNVVQPVSGTSHITGFDSNQNLIIKSRLNRNSSFRSDQEFDMYEDFEGSLRPVNSALNTLKMPKEPKGKQKIPLRELDLIVNDVKLENWQTTSKSDFEIKKKTIGFKNEMLEREKLEQMKDLIDQGFVKQKEMTEEMFFRTVLNENEFKMMNRSEDTPTSIINFFLIENDSGLDYILVFIETVLSIASSYFYTYQAAFRNTYALDEEFGKQYEYYCFYTELYTEIAFAVLMLSHFLTTFTPDGGTAPVRHLPAIVYRYLRGGFLFDLLCLLPITLVFLH